MIRLNQKPFSFPCRLLLMGFVFATIGASPLQAQDFLKQLEEKLLRQKTTESETSNSKPESTAEDLPPPKRKEEPAKSAAIGNPFDMGPGASSPNIPASPIEIPQIGDLFGANKNSNGNASSSDSSRPNSRGAANESPLPENSSPGIGSGYLGLVAEETNGSGIGLLVAEVTQNSPAWKAGFEVGDRLLGVDGFAISKIDDLAERLFATSIGQPVEFLINRRGRNMGLTAVLQDRNIAARVAGQSSGNDFGRAVTPIGPPQLGVIAYDLSDAFRRQFSIRAFRGAAVAEVERGTPARNAGILAGDCIVEIDGEVIQSADDLRGFMDRANVGDVLNMSLYRGQGLVSLVVPLTANRAAVASGLNFDPTDRSMQPYQPLAPRQAASQTETEYVRSLESELIRVQKELLEKQREIDDLNLRVLELERAGR
jgi:membrane-associated protease RseP (regulator of RpoE activity)